MKQIGIVGAGNMGSGIAQKYATENCHVILVDLNQEALKKGQNRIKDTLEEGVSRRIFTEEAKQNILNHLTFLTDLNDLKNVDLVIEAIFEDKNYKKDLFQKLDVICVPKTIFATNTSSFYVSELANATQRTDRFIGLHYFYHPAKNKLVEVIKGLNTSEETFLKVWGLQEKIGKIAIESKDAPGFIVNRFFVPWLNEAARIVDEKIANIATVEAAAKEAFGITMGPFELMNVTGTPIALHAATTLANELGAFYKPCALINPIVESKLQWDLSGEVNKAVLDKVAARLMGCVFFVTTQMVLGEKVCNIEDCDLGARVGLRWEKGPFELMNQFSPSFVTSRLENEIGFITFNRPDAMNALNETVIWQLETCFKNLKTNPNVRGIVIEGRGKAFVAGADTHFFVEQIQNNDLDRIVSFTKQAQALFFQIDTCPKPVACLIDGLALGGGLELALACDFIVASSKAKMGFPETGIGIYPGLGGTQRTPRKIGTELARWLVLSGEIIDGQQAKQIGLADEICDSSELKAVAQKLIATPSVTKPSLQGFEELIAQYALPLSDLMPTEKKLNFKAPLALKIADELIKTSLSMTLEEGLQKELTSLKEIFQTDDALIGLSSIGKHKPTFMGK